MQTFFLKVITKGCRKGANQDFGGAERDRTADPLLAKQVLSQLSYSPVLISKSFGGPGKT